MGRQDTNKQQLVFFSSGIPKTDIFSSDVRESQDLSWEASKAGNPTQTGRIVGFMIPFTENIVDKF